MNRFRYDSTTDLLGAHVSTRGGVCTIFERGREIGATALAFFSKNSNQWRAKPLSDEDCANFLELRQQAQIGPILIHAAYLINLAATHPEFHERSIEALTIELERAERLRVPSLVLHPGSHMGAGVAEGLDRVARSLDRIHRAIPDCPTITLLETSAGQGSSLGCRFEELGQILRIVDDPRRLGICFDTCHVFGAGYPLHTRDGYETTIEELDRHVGVEQVGAFHLNDSKRPLDSRVDRHQHIGEGEIGLDGFGFLLNDPRFAGLPKLLETPKTEPLISDRRNLATLRSLMARREPHSSDGSLTR